MSRSAKVDVEPGEERVKKENESFGGDVKEEIKDADVKPPTPRTPKDQYLQLMLEFAPHVELAFNDLSLARSTAIAVFRKVEKNTVDGEYSVVRFRSLLENLLFARLPQEPKEKWQTEEGKRASKLRRMVMLSCLAMARKNLFRDFSSKQFPDNAKHTIPMWLTKKMHDNVKVKDANAKGGVRWKRMYRNYILKEYVLSAVDKEEKRKDYKVEYYNRMAVCRVGYPSRADTADYALSYLYRSLLNMFTATRRSAKVDFFTSVGYLFIDWKHFPECEVHDSDVALTWAAPLGNEADMDIAWDQARMVTYATVDESDEQGNVA